jgi:Trypsin-like peptidase domain
MKSLFVGTALSLLLLTGSLGLPTLPALPLASGLADGQALDLDPATDGAVALPAAGPAWNPSGAIHPGIQTFTGGNQCTANFVFYDAADIYIGQAAHCAGTGAATDVNGCTASFMPLGTAVDLGTGHDGTLVYSSWALMQSLGTPDSAPECLGNDFALVRVAEADEGDVSPAVPFFGGPVGVAPTAGLGLGDEVYSFGNSGLRLGVEPVLSWKHGTVLASDAWSADVYTVTPGIPGDSGSGFMDAEGNAIGVLSTVSVAPFPLMNTIAALDSALAYRSAHGGAALELATAPWVGGLA